MPCLLLRWWPMLRCISGHLSSRVRNLLCSAPLATACAATALAANPAVTTAIAALAAALAPLAAALAAATLSTE